MISYFKDETTNSYILLAYRNKIFVLDVTDAVASDKPFSERTLSMDQVYSFKID